MKEQQQNILDADEWWTIDRAALHLGYTRATIERYVREGLPVYFKHLGGWIKRDELLADVRRRNANQRATRLKKV